MYLKQNIFFIYICLSSQFISTSLLCLKLLFTNLNRSGYEDTFPIYISFYDSEIELVCISVKKISRHKHPRALWLKCKHIPQQNIWQEFSYEHKHFYVPQIIRHPVFYENYKKLESHAPDTWIKELTHKLRIFSREILISIMHFIYDSFGFCCCFVTFCKLISINYIIS